MFPISVWNQFNNDGSRTNNTVEGFNLKLNKILSSHPNVVIFIRKIQSEKSTSSFAYNRINDGSFRRRGRNKVDVQTDLNIQKLKSSYLARKMTTMEYLEQVIETGPKKEKKRKNKTF